jgi:hypothetical protein
MELARRVFLEFEGGMMRKDETPEDAAERLKADSNADEPFRSSGSGETYEPSGNWGAERRLDQPGPDRPPHGMEGAASGAGYGGFGPEGDYGGAAGDPNADIIGQVNADRDRLAEQAQADGPVRPGRAFMSEDRSPATGQRDPDESDRQHDTRLNAGRDKPTPDSARRDPDQSA